MKRAQRETRAVQREALMARAELQRLQMRGALTHFSSRSAVKGMGALALGVSRLLVQNRTPGSALEPRPWMLTAGMLLVRTLRASPTARWVTGAVAVGGAIWWVARALRTPDEPEDEGG